MKAALIILLVSLSFAFTYSQNSFIATFGDQDLNLPLDVKEIGGNYYIATASFDGALVPNNKTSIIRMNAAGEVIDKKIFITDANQYYPIKKIIPLDQNEFLLFGSCRENETSNSSIWIMKMDTLLNILWERKYLNIPKNGSSHA